MAENRLSSTSKPDSNEKIGEFWDSHDFPARGSATYAVARNKGSLTSHDMYPRLTPQALRYPPLRGLSTCDRPLSAGN
jgi:hypothetical protein